MNYSHVFSLANLLSLSRVFLLIPIFYFLTRSTPGANYYAIVVMLLAMATDTLDGYVARKLNQTSDLGRVLDPVADKICVGAVVVFLTLYRDFPLWLLLLILARDVAIMLAGLYIIKRKSVVVESNRIGKTTVLIVALMIVSYSLELKAVSEILIWATLLMLLLSFGSYLNKFLKLMKNGNRSQQGGVK